MSRSNTLTTLAALRLAIGTASWATPRIAGKTFGLDASANPQSPYLARLFGVRDFALGYGILTTTGETRRQWLAIGAACDVADAVAGIAGARAGYLPKVTSFLVTGAAVAAAGLGVAALRDAE
jgi:hypothetical protein